LLAKNRRGAFLCDGLDSLGESVWIRGAYRILVSKLQICSDLGRFILLGRPRFRTMEFMDSLVEGIIGWPLCIGELGNSFSEIIPVTALVPPFRWALRELGGPVGRKVTTDNLTREEKLVIWLILPVVICLFQRLSHACLSISELI
jgi:hypothetical protein